MAASWRGLAFVLTMAAWLPASIHTGSLDSGWWGTKEALQLRQAAADSIRHGKFDEAERLYGTGVDLGARHRDPLAQAWFLDGVGSARLAQLHLRSAADAYLDAKAWAEKARDRAALGAIDADLASVYEQTGDFDSALSAAREARAIAPSGAYYRPQVLFLLGRLLSNSDSIPLYRDGIEAARRAAPATDPNHVLEAYGWDLLCQALVQSDDLNGADAAEQNSLALRLKSDRRDLAFSDWLSGGIRLRQAEQSPEGPARDRLLVEAEDFTRQATLQNRQPPAYHLAYQQGRILLAQHRTRQALEALEQAVIEGQRWRLGLVPTLSTIDGAAASLQIRIFDSFIETAADYGLRTGQKRWIEESLEAAELNRAVNLRESAQKVPALSPEYREVLAHVEAEETRLLRTGASASPLADRLRLELTELEAKTGLRFSSNIAENFPSHASLIHFQQSLGDSGILLSFALGERESFLWAVTRNSLNVYRLPPKGEIVSTVREFRHAVESDGSARGDRPNTEVRPGFEALGEQLYHTLFGQLRPAEASKTGWQISAESALLEVPFAALVVDQIVDPQILDREQHKLVHPYKPWSGRNVFLAEKHSLQVKAGALLPGKYSLPSSSGFVSVGDPIYNLADPRVSTRAAYSWAGSSWFLAGFGTPDGQLNRLPGTRPEVELSAAAWQASSTQKAGPAPTVLEGSAATRQRLFEAISPAPAVIHLATHALTAPAGGEAFLALTLGPDGRPEMLGANEIRTLDVPGSVVVMTGCATAPSQVRPGLALAGLVRAWTIAGAAAVVATEWPVRDSAGSALLERFYVHLRAASNASPEAAVAEALRLAQVESIGSNAASYWAAYQVFTGQAGAGRISP
jgi:hypothetical protein